MAGIIAFFVAIATFLFALGLFGMAVMWAMIDWHYSIYFGVAGTLIVLFGWFIFDKLKG